MSGLRIITADERLTQTKGIKGVIIGPSGIGKTSLLWTLEADSSLFLNAEAGDLSVQDWPGDMVDVRTWHNARDLACFIGGPNPALRPDQPYSQAHYDSLDSLAKTFDLNKYRTIFIDSITVASRDHPPDMARAGWTAICPVFRHSGRPLLSLRPCGPRL